MTVTDECLHGFAPGRCTICTPPLAVTGPPPEAAHLAIAELARKASRLDVLEEAVTSEDPEVLWQVAVSDPLAAAWIEVGRQRERLGRIDTRHRAVEQLRAAGVLDPSDAARRLVL